MNQQAPITKKGLERIRQEMNHLVRVEREKIKKALQEAREMGDLKENAEYHSAKEKQALNEGKIAELQAVIATSKIVDTSSIVSDKIVFGAKVCLYDNTKNEEVVYKIVGEKEASFSSQFISYTSPLGKSLIGKEEGDVVTVRVPKGEVEYEVQSFEYE